MLAQNIKAAPDAKGAVSKALERRRRLVKDVNNAIVSGMRISFFNEDVSIFGDEALVRW